MSNPNTMEPRPTRRFLSGLAFLGGLLTVSFIQNAAQMNLIGSAISASGILSVALLHWRLERDIPHGVDVISKQVAQLPEDIRQGLRDFLKGKDKD